MILGNHVTVSCLVSAVSMDGAMNIRWKINGRWVKPLLNSRIQTTELNRDSYDPSLYTSNLIINGIKKVDTGIKINTKPVQVKPLPIKHLIDRVIWESYEQVHKYRTKSVLCSLNVFWCSIVRISFISLYCFFVSENWSKTSLYQRPYPVSWSSSRCQLLWSGPSEACCFVCYRGQSWMRGACWADLGQ